jgi:hypothetical protein
MPEQTPQGAVVPAAWRAVRSYRGVLLQRAAHGASPTELDHAVGIGVRMLLRTIARELTDATDADAAELIEVARAKALRAVLTATDFAAIERRLHNDTVIERLRQAHDTLDPDQPAA